MTTPEQGTWKKWFVGAAALSWAVFGLLWAQVIALPSPFLPPRSFAELLGEVPATTSPERFIVMILKETSLVLCAFALLGLLLAALAYRAGTRGGSLVAALLCAITVAVSLVPMAQAEGWPPPRTLRFRCPGTSRAPLSRRNARRRPRPTHAPGERN
jgi:hypothetical protein